MKKLLGLMLVLLMLFSMTAIAESAVDAAVDAVEGMAETAVEAAEGAAGEAAEAVEGAAEAAVEAVEGAAGEAAEAVEGAAETAVEAAEEAVETVEEAVEEAAAETEEEAAEEGAEAEEEPGGFLDGVAKVNNTVNGKVWGMPALILLGFVGILMTVLTKVFQVSHLKHWFRQTIGTVFKDKHVTGHTKDKSISQFQSLCTALAATVGTGNIVGVAGAILFGGPGAVFWMWAMAVLGMMTN